MNPLRVIVEDAIVQWLERVHDCSVASLWRIEAPGNLDADLHDPITWIWYHHPSGGQEVHRYIGGLDKLLFEVVGLLP